MNRGTRRFSFMNNRNCDFGAALKRGQNVHEDSISGTHLITAGRKVSSDHDFQFDALSIMIYFYIMKIATTADLRNHFRRVSGWLDNGETVEVIRRGRPYARLSPWVTATPQTAKIDFAAQRREVWRGRKFSPAEVAAMRAAELEGDEG